MACEGLCNPSDVVISEIEDDPLGGIVLWLELPDLPQNKRWAWIQCRKDRVMLVLDRHDDDSIADILNVEDLSAAMKTASDFLGGA